MSFWKTNAQIDELYNLVVVEGMSFSQAARVMGAISRNVLLCKFNRLRHQDPAKWQVRAIPGLRPRPVRVKVVAPPKPPPPKEAELEMFLMEGNVVTMETLKHNHCRYPIGDPVSEAFRLCGHEIRSGSVYCPTHHEICYVPNLPRKRHGRAA